MSDRENEYLKTRYGLCGGIDSIEWGKLPFRNKHLDAAFMAESERRERKLRSKAPTEIYIGKDCIDKWGQDFIPIQGTPRIVFCTHNNYKVNRKTLIL